MKSVLAPIARHLIALALCVGLATPALADTADGVAAAEPASVAAALKAAGRHPLAKCESGQATGERCAFEDDADLLTEIEYMPEHLRASHEAAGNRGVYPANGALRLHVCQDCQEALVDDDWCAEV